MAESGKSNKTLQLLHTFNGKDLERFDTFIESDFFNKNKQVVKFFRYLKTFHPQYEEKNVNKKLLFKKFFPHQSYDDKKIRYLFTDLTQLLEMFLGVTNFLNDERKFSQGLLDEHINRNNISEFNRLFNVHTREEKNSGHDANWYFNRFQLEYKSLIYAFSHRKRKEESNIEQTLENLDKFYIARKLELSCEVENAKSLLTKNYKSFNLDNLVEKIREHEYAKTPIIEVYLHVLALLRDKENENHFNALSKALKKNENCFAQNELRELYQYLLNFCVRMINLGKMDYLSHIFEIYKVIIENKVLLPAGILSQWDFKNVITTSLRLKEFEWAEHFINTYKIYIPEKERKNAYTYNMANLYFQKKQYGLALKLLNTVEFTDIVYQLDTRSMLLKIYFETGDDDALFYHFSAFRKFIRRMRTLSKYQQTSYRNLVTYVQKLSKAEGDKLKIKQLAKEVEANPHVADATWLKLKIGEGLK